MKSLVPPLLVARVAAASLLAILAADAIGCMADPATETVGEARSAITAWNTSSFTSGTNTAGQTLPSGFPNCVLAGVTGDFNEGQSPQWDVASDFSEAGVINNKLFAHGGFFTDQTNQPDWSGNTVGASVTCFDTQVTGAGSAVWGGLADESFNPVKIADVGTSRECFLQFMQAASGSFNGSSDFVEVKKHTTTDSLHPTTGWYIEGHVSSPTSLVGPPIAVGVCFDLPSGYDGGTYTVTSTSGSSHTTTFANYLAACGLTKITGPLAANSQASGVFLDITSSGFWRINASNGQSGAARCVDW